MDCRAKPGNDRGSDHADLLPALRFSLACLRSFSLEASMAKVLYERDGRIARITLNRP